MEEVRRLDATRISQDVTQRVFMPMGRLEARYGGGPEAATHIEESPQLVQRRPDRAITGPLQRNGPASPVVGERAGSLQREFPIAGERANSTGHPPIHEITPVTLPSRETDMVTCPRRLEARHSAIVSPPAHEVTPAQLFSGEPDRDMLTALVELEELVVAGQDRVQCLVHERDMMGQERLKEYSAEAEQRILGLEDFIGTLQEQVQRLLKDAAEGRQGTTNADDLKDMSVHSEQRIRDLKDTSVQSVKRIRGLEDLAESFKKQLGRLSMEKHETADQDASSAQAIDVLRGSTMSALLQHDQALEKAGTRLLALEKRLAANEDLGKLLAEQAEQVNENQQPLLSSLQTEVTKLAQQLSRQEIDQESLASKVAAWDDAVKLLIDDVVELRAHSESRPLQTSGVEQIEKDLLGLRDSHETHEELILSVDGRIKGLSEQMNMYKRQQDAAVQQFNARTCHMSRNLHALTLDVNHLATSVDGSRSISPVLPSFAAPSKNYKDAFGHEEDKTIITEHTEQISEDLNQTVLLIDNKIEAAENK